MDQRAGTAVDCLSVGVLVADHLCAPIDHAPRAGELVLTDNLELSIGGCAANAAMDLARVGVRVGAIGCVGRDPFGQFIEETLAGAGVETSGIRRLDGVGTSGTLIVNVRGEDRRFIHMVGANAGLNAKEIPLERVRQAKVLYVGGYLLLAGCDQEGLTSLFREARRSGVKTFLDVVLPGPGDHWSRLEQVLSETDVFHANDDEGKAIAGRDEPIRQAERFRDAGAGTAIITRGGQETILLSDEARLRAGVYPVEFVGGTGAGDAFDAGYIAGMLAGESPRKCLEWGSALGASCVRSISATETVFDRRELLEFMRAHALPVEAI